MAQDEEEQGAPATETSSTSGASTAAGRLAAQRAAKAAAKASKRGTAAVPNPVAQGVHVAGDWYQRHDRVLWAGLLIVVVGAIAFFATKAQLGKKDHEAAQFLVKANETMQAPIIAAGEEPTGDAPDESYATATARAQKARAAFQAVSKRFGDATAARFAKLGEAAALASLGKYAQAQKLYERLAAHKDSEPFVQAQALEGAALALEGQQKYAEAASRFEKLAALDQGRYKTPANYHRARMLAAQNQQQKAADLLQALLKAERARPAKEGGVMYEGVVSNADTLLAELSAALGKPVPGSAAPSMQSATPGPVMDDRGSGLSKEIIESLRKQIESGQGGKGLNKELLKQLEQQAGDSPAPTPGEK